MYFSLVMAKRQQTRVQKTATSTEKKKKNTTAGCEHEDCKHEEVSHKTKKRQQMIKANKTLNTMVGANCSQKSSNVVLEAFLEAFLEDAKES